MAKAKAPKYPRVVVSPERHIALQEEAERENKSIAAIAEEKFEKAD